MKLAAVEPFAAVPAQDEPPEVTAEEISEEKQKAAPIDTEIAQEFLEGAADLPLDNNFISLKDYLSGKAKKSAQAFKGVWGKAPSTSYVSKAIKTYQKVAAQIADEDPVGGVYESET